MLVSVAIAWTPTASAAQAVGDSAVIRSRVAAYLEAWDAHDVPALGALFAEDADFVMGNQPAARGRREIEAWWQTYFDRQEPERHLDLDVHPPRFLTPDVAIMSVTTTTGGTDSRGRDLLPRSFRGVWLWRRQGGVWLISAMRGLPLQEDRVSLNASLGAAETLRPGVRGFVAAYEEAFNAHDATLVTGFFSDDAEMIVRNSPVASGRDAIQAWWRAYFSAPRPYRALLVIDDIRTIGPGVVLVNVTGTGDVRAPAVDQPIPLRYTRATWVLTAEAGEWRIAQLLVLPSEDDDIIRSGVPSN